MSNLKLLTEGEEGYGVIVEWNTKGGSTGFVSNELQDKELLREFQENKEKKGINSANTILMTCILQKYDTENKNGRVYSKELLVREDKNYQELIREGRALGQCDHPSDSTISLKGDEITHRVIKTWWDDNTLMGILEILTSDKFHLDGTITCQGDFIANLLRKGVKIGISSRGVGSLRNIQGRNVVQDDFELICYDLVASPSTPGAFLYPDKNVSINENTTIKKENLIENKINDTLDNFLL